MENAAAPTYELLPSLAPLMAPLLARGCSASRFAPGALGGFEGRYGDRFVLRCVLPPLLPPVVLLLLLLAVLLLLLPKVLAAALILKQSQLPVLRPDAALDGDLRRRAGARTGLAAGRGRGGANKRAAASSHLLPPCYSAAARCTSARSIPLSPSAQFPFLGSD